MEKKKYYSSLHDKYFHRNNDEDDNNIIENSNLNKFLNFPKLNLKRKHFLHSSAIELKPSKNHTSNLPEYIHKKAIEYKLHPFRKPNLKILGEDVKNHLEKDKGRMENKNKKSNLKEQNKIVKINESNDSSALVKSRRNKAKSKNNNSKVSLKSPKKLKRKNIKFDSTSKLLKFRKIIRTRNLYDSNDDDESDDETKEGFVINPEKKIFILYDFLIIAFFLYNFIFSTTDLCLERNFCSIDNKFSVSDILLLINDIFYIFDFILSFFRCYYNFEHKLIKSNRLIVKNFLKYDFIFELLSAIPIFSISKYKCMIGFNNFHNYKYETPGFILILRLCSILKALKIKKIMNNHNKNQALEKFIDLISNNYTIEKIVWIVIHSLMYIGILHCIVCIHIFLGKNSYSNWLIKTNSLDESFGLIYIKSLYFIVTTLTTVGYGDIVCISYYERIYQLIILVIGSVLYPYIISTMGNIVKKESNAEIKLENNLSMLEIIRQDYPNIPFKLYMTVHKYLEKKSCSIEKYDLNSFIESLPFSLKNQILFTMYDKYVHNFKFFKKNNNSVFIAEVLNNFIPTTAKKNEFLIYEGELVEEIIFIKDGKISFNAAINTEEPSSSINKYFLERFAPFTKEEENNLLKENLNNITHTSQITNKSYDKTRNKLNNVLKNFTYEVSCEDKANLQIIQNIEINNYNDFDIKGGAIINDEGNYQYLKIVDIRKNEHFGCVFISLNKPCPLSLQVRSKFAELFLFKKAQALNLSRNYPNIWQKLYGKEFLNIIKIKKKTFSMLRKYIELNELLINNNVKDIINLNEITRVDINFLEKSIMSSPKNKRHIKENLFRNEIMRHNTINHEYDKKHKKIKIEEKLRDDLKTKIEKRVRFRRTSTFSGSLIHLLPNKKFSQKSSNYINQKSSFKNIVTENALNEENGENKINSPGNTKEVKNNKKSYKEKLKDLKSFLKLSKNFFETNGDIKNSPRKNCLKIRESNLNGKITSTMITKKIGMESDTNIDTNLNKIQNGEQLLRDLKDICREETNFSFCSMNKENNFNSKILSIDNNSNFQILSGYQNLNKISKGKYINDINFQNKIKLIVKAHYLYKKKGSNIDNSLSLRTFSLSSDFENNNNISENESRKNKLEHKNNDKELKHKNKIEKEKLENNLNNEDDIKIKNRDKKLDYIYKRKILTKNQTKEDSSKTYNKHTNNNLFTNISDFKLKNQELTAIKKNKTNESNSIKVNKSQTASEKSRSHLRNKSCDIKTKKNVKICNKKEYEFIIDKESDKNVNDENVFIDNNSKVNHNIKIKKNFKRRYFNHNSSIYDDKNNQIINHILGSKITNNLISKSVISDGKEHKKNYFNSVGKIKKIDASVNIYNIIQKDFETNENNNNLNKSFCFIF